MNATLTFLKQNFRWLLPGVLLTFLSCFGQTFFISLFAGHIRTEFNLTHGEWGGIYSIGTTASAIVMVWAGVMTDHFRVRALGAVVLALLAAACVWMAETHSAWALPFLIFALRFTGQGMLTHIAVVAMARWFVATRGRALAIASLGFSIGEAFLPIIVVSIMTAENWHQLWWISATIALAGIPTLWFLLAKERTPQSMANATEALGMSGRHWTRHEALRHSLFWFMVPALLGPSAFNTAFFFQQVHFAEIKGWDHSQLVALFPVFTFTGIGAMLLSGWALDKIGTARLLPWSQLPMVVSFSLFAITDSLAGTLIALVFQGITSGASTTLVAAFWAEFYGTRHIGAIKSAATAVMVLGSAIGPAITGGLIDMGIGLLPQFLGVSGYFLLTTALMLVGISAQRGNLPAR
ncbi:MFS transporter [Shimia abyssi]|uniref:Sugar phosphate permease n=1 Tax=Shimia abyssi TaxID=1662395 RepID=A0A2P8F899_9RHOB|nr:MFS transporter [Shimia abyssi]PSL17950.1 sugar phosphate permease [Shimia abyssi]